jgi:phosphoglycerate kinase
VAILGGAKVSDKLQVIHNLIKIADHILICGGMTFTFLKAKDLPIGKSLLEVESINDAKQILNDGKDKIVLPSDFYCGNEFADVKQIYKKFDEISDDLMGLDVGEETIKRFNQILENAKTIFWNGPAGVFEFSHFQFGTKSICQTLKDKTNSGAFTLIGGGDSASAAVALGFKESDFSFISTGGGASLELIGGQPLPGIEAIQDKV